jgi:hypothetical protein
MGLLTSPANKISTPVLEIPDFLISILIPSVSPFSHPASSGKKISAAIVVALKAACIVIVAQSDPVRS